MAAQRLLKLAAARCCRCTGSFINVSVIVSTGLATTPKRVPTGNTWLFRDDLETHGVLGSRNGERYVRFLQNIDCTNDEMKQQELQDPDDIEITKDLDDSTNSSSIANSRDESNEEFSIFSRHSLVMYETFVTTGCFLVLGGLCIWHARLISRGETSIEGHINRSERKRHKEKKMKLGLIMFGGST